VAAVVVGAMVKLVVMVEPGLVDTALAQELLAAEQAQKANLH